MNEYYCAVIYLTIVAMAIMIAIVGGSNYLSKDIKFGYVFTFSAIIVVAISEFLGVYLDGHSENTRTLHYIVKFIEFSVAPFIPLVFANMIFKIRKKERIFIQSILIAHVIFEFVSIFYKFVFYIDEQNIYHHADYYWIYLAVCLIVICYLFVVGYFFSKRYQNQNGYILLLILIFIASGIVVQTIKPNIRIDWITIAMASTFMYIYHNGLMQYVDGLTQLLNQKTFLTYTANLKNTATVIVFDIDDFKSINDAYGHQFGDKCLVEAAKIIKECYRKYGTCYRIGGDEFAVILESSDKIEELNIMFMVNIEMYRIKVDDRFPTISIGHSMFNPEYDIITDVIEKADKNMYNAKNIKKERK